MVGASTRDIGGTPWQDWQNSVKVFAIDSLGNEKWYWESELSLEEIWLWGLNKSDNGNWVYTTSKSILDFDGTQRFQPRFIIRDTNFNVIEDRFVDATGFSFFNYLLNLVPISTGGWLAVGTDTEDVADPIWAPNHAYSWMLRLDENGDSLWARNDLAFPDTPTYQSQQFLHSAVELPSGSIIAAGYHTPHTLFPNSGILVKVNKDGCMVDCTPPTATVATKKDGRIRVYPNPATERLFIRMPEAMNIDARCILYDAYGQRVKSLFLGKGIREQEVPLSGIPAGLYFWEVKNRDGRGGSGKVVIAE